MTLDGRPGRRSPPTCGSVTPPSSASGASGWPRPPSTTSPAKPAARGPRSTATSTASPPSCAPRSPPSSTASRPRVIDAGRAAPTFADAVVAVVVHGAARSARARRAAVPPRPRTRSGARPPRVRPRRPRARRGGRRHRARVRPLALARRRARAPATGSPVSCARTRSCPTRPSTSPIPPPLARSSNDSSFPASQKAGRCHHDQPR